MIFAHKNNIFFVKLMYFYDFSCKLMIFATLQESESDQPVKQFEKAILIH
jgi:hypothetical protein